MESTDGEAMPLQLDTPKMLIQLSNNSNPDFKLLGRFTEKTLIIVYIQAYPLDPRLMNFLPRLLWELHELNIIFITKEDPSNWQNDLYSYCFYNGFINVLLIQKLRPEILLYSYNPYPTMRTLRLPLLEDYLNRWRQLLNLQQYPVRTLLFSVEPRIFQYINRKGERIQSGYLYNVLKEFTDRHNSSIQIVKEIDVDELYDTGISLYINRSIDIVCYIKHSHLNITSTKPLHLVPLRLAVPHSKPIASYLYFVRPFTWTLWLAVIAAIGYGMLMLYGSNRNRRTEIGKHFLSSWCNLLFISQPRIIFANWQQVVIHYIMLLSGFILTNFYLALLSSMLTSGLFEEDYNTFQDLERSPYTLLTDSYYASFMNESSYMPEIIKQRINVADSNVLETARVTMNTSYMYTRYEDRLDGFLFQQHLLKVPLFKVIPKSLWDGFMSFPVVNGLPYLNIMNTYLSRIFEHGILSKIKTDTYLDAIEGGITKFIASDGIERKPFSVEFYYYAFALWGVGLILASLCFFLELLRHRMTNQIQM
ncbi:uncharacterized protein LOC6583394 [Drosophila mojavensis]|uniref:uncharacterized protein LOC6583394 n=1 Tax=Drosophila mojavensis TaxID=7230 RepID=UPI00017CA4C2|nr:uncharacterized protein LOC6583394 [Drosophila mojavensis]